jgi:hypothetical protein
MTVGASYNVKLCSSAHRQHHHAVSSEAVAAVAASLQAAIALVRKQP